MRRGLFITVEGPDGSGKSTQIEYLRNFFSERNTECLFTREPGGTAIGEKLRDIILDRNNREMCDMTEALLYAASRAQHVNQLIRPVLEAGGIVICDRFIDSSIAYQGYGRSLGDSVRLINELAVGDCMPDVTFLLELSPKEGKSRIEENGQDRLEQEKIEFHNRVFEGYEKIADLYPERFVRIDAGRDRMTVKKDILEHMEHILRDRGF
ncbi:MAG: dTMP kinase [Anaerovoracaceae bacterium]